MASHGTADESGTHREIKIGTRTERHDTIVTEIAMRATDHPTMRGRLQCLYETAATSVIEEMIGSALGPIAYEHPDLAPVLAEVLVARGSTNLYAIQFMGDVAELLAAEMKHEPLPGDIDALRPVGKV